MIFWPPTHGILNPCLWYAHYIHWLMMFWHSYAWYIYLLGYGILTPIQGTLCILKSLSMVYRTTYLPAAYGIFTPHCTHCIPNPLYFELIVMVYWTHHLWDFDTPTHDISNSLPIIYWPPTHCILNTLIFWHLYAWFTEPRIYDILTSLPMAYWTPYQLYFDPLPMVYRTPCLWNIKHPTHGVLNPLPIVFWPSSWLMVNRTPFQ